MSRPSQITLANLSFSPQTPAHSDTGTIAIAWVRVRIVSSTSTGLLNPLQIKRLGFFNDDVPRGLHDRTYEIWLDIVFGLVVNELHSNVHPTRTRKVPTKGITDDGQFDARLLVTLRTRSPLPTQSVGDRFAVSYQNTRAQSNFFFSISLRKRVIQSFGPPNLDPIEHLHHQP